jgi:hypothetical protein
MIMSEQAMMEIYIFETLRKPKLPLQYPTSYVTLLRQYHVIHHSPVNNAKPTSIVVVGGTYFYLWFLNKIWRFQLAICVDVYEPTATQIKYCYNDESILSFSLVKDNIYIHTPNIDIMLFSVKVVQAAAQRMSARYVVVVVVVVVGITYRRRAFSLIDWVIGLLHITIV